MEKPIFFEHQKKQENQELLITQKQFDEFKVAFNQVCSTEAGKTTFRFIQQFLSFKESSLVFIDGVLDRDAMSHNEARRDVWIKLREFLPVNVRNEIERDI